MRKIFLIIALFIFLLPCKGYTQKSGDLYSEGVNAARSGDLDFAFMHFRGLLTAVGESIFSEGALFAVGEYYFLVADYYDAYQTFDRFVKDYPDSPARIFALAYLLEITRKQERKDIIKNLEKAIVTFQQLSLVFSDFKTHTYLSPLSKNYRVIYFIDRVEFYIDEKLFTKISY